MAKPISLLLFLATILAFLSTNANAQFDPQSMCKDVEHPQLCQSLMKTVRANSPANALEVAIQTSLTKTIEAHGLFQKLWATAKPEDKGGLNTCRKFYSDAVYELKKSLASLKRKDRDTLRHNLSGVMHYFDECHNGFGGGGPGGYHVPPLPVVSQVNTPLQQLAVNNLSFATNINLS